MSLVVLGTFGFSATAQNDSIAPVSVDRSGLDGLSAFGEKVLDLLTWEKGRRVFVIYPAGGYSARTGLEMGIMPVLSWKNKPKVNRQQEHSNTLSTSCQVSTQGMVELQSELEWIPTKLWQVRLKTEWMRINDRLWLPGTNGVGMEYATRQVGVAGEILHQVGNHVYAGLALQADYFDFSDWADDPASKTVYGRQGGLVAGLGPVFLIDHRNHLLYPTKGTYLKLSSVIHASGLASEYEFQNYRVDARTFFPWGNMVLASQVLWEYTPGEVPFFMLPKLGGKERLRGIGHSQRIVDRNIWLMQSELRLPLWWRFGAVAFAGLGQAADQPSWNMDELIYSGGAGLRFRMLPREPLNIRFDLGIASRGMSGFFISLREAF
jgi:hypothetical protein